MNKRRFLTRTAAAFGFPYIIKPDALGLNGAVAPSNRITLGVIGAGSQGTVDMRGFLQLDEVCVTAVCDVNRKNIERARGHIKEAYGSDDVRVHADFRELNADPSIDAVLMALPVHWHSIPSLDAIGHRKHIYHEKPMALTMAEAKRVREAVRRHSVVFQFGTQQRSDLKFRWACELALNGSLGRIREIQVAVPPGHGSEVYPEEAVPEWLDWDRWVGPAPMSPFHSKKLLRDNHENISDFSLGMISCWGIHHLDMAQWGNDTELTGPSSVEGSGEFPASGTCNAVQTWKVRFEFAGGAPVLFTDEKQQPHGIRFHGEDGWVHVKRGDIQAEKRDLLLDPQNKPGAMPVKLPVSTSHYQNFVDAIKGRAKPVAGIETAVRSDALCQLAFIAIKQGRKLQWDAQSEKFANDDGANAMLEPRPVRGPWRL